MEVPDTEVVPRILRWCLVNGHGVLYMEVVPWIQRWWIGYGVVPWIQRWCNGYRDGALEEI